MTERKLDLEAKNVLECECTVEQARELIGSDNMPEAMDIGLDEAQGYVADGKGDHAYLVIKIK